jgi:hypothetical protein
MGAPGFKISTSYLQLRKNISDYFVRLHFEIWVTFAFERTNSCFFEPFLKAIYAKTVFAFVAFHGVNKYSVTYMALDVV